MIVVDSSAWISHLRRHDTLAVRALKSLRDPGEIIVGDLILLEVLRGARHEREASEIERELRVFAIEPMMDVATAVQAAAAYRALRRQGVTVRSTVDLIVATFCVRHGHALLHDDRDFARLERLIGLQLVQL